MLLSVARNEHIKESYKPIMVNNSSNLEVSKTECAGHLKDAVARCLSIDHPALNTYIMM